jgi:hypothetical protein
MSQASRQHTGGDCQVSPVDGQDAEAEAERAVLTQLLRPDHIPQWSIAELLGELDEIHAAALHRALRQLAEAGVVYRSGRFVWVTGAIDRLSKLDMIHRRSRGDSRRSH